MVGVHRGLKVSYHTFIEEGISWFQLLDKCLKALDSELFDYLMSKNLSAEIYAFPCMSALARGDPSWYGSGIDFLRLYPASRGGPAIVGVSLLERRNVVWADE